MGQDRKTALLVIRSVKMLFADVPGAVDVHPMKVSKSHVLALVRSVAWERNGYHVVLRPDFGKRVALLSACADHSKCLPDKVRS